MQTQFYHDFPDFLWKAYIIITLAIIVYRLLCNRKVAQLIAKAIVFIPFLIVLFVMKLGKHW